MQARDKHTKIKKKKSENRIEKENGNENEYKKMLKHASRDLLRREGKTMFGSTQGCNFAPFNM